MLPFATQRQASRSVGVIPLYNAFCLCSIDRLVPMSGSGSLINSFPPPSKQTSSQQSPRLSLSLTPRRIGIQDQTAKCSTSCTPRSTPSSTGAPQLAALRSLSSPAHRISPLCIGQSGSNGYLRTFVCRRMVPSERSSRRYWRRQCQCSRGCSPTSQGRHSSPHAWTSKGTSSRSASGQAVPKSVPSTSSFHHSRPCPLTPIQTQPEMDPETNSRQYREYRRLLAEDRRRWEAEKAQFLEEAHATWLANRSSDSEDEQWQEPPFPPYVHVPYLRMWHEEFLDNAPVEHRWPESKPSYVDGLDCVKKTVDLRGKTLQVIVKLANIVLTPEKPEYGGGTWHVEGKSGVHGVLHSPLKPSIKPRDGQRGDRLHVHLRARGPLRHPAYLLTLHAVLRYRKHHRINPVLPQRRQRASLSRPVGPLLHAPSLRDLSVRLPAAVRPPTAS